MTQNIGFDIQKVIKSILAYIALGLTVAVAAFFIPNKKLEISEIMLIALIAAATFSLLDLMAPRIGESARYGAGAVIGSSLAGGIPTTSPAPALR